MNKLRKNEKIYKNHLKAIDLYSKNRIVAG